MRGYSILFIAALIAATVASFRYSWFIWVPVVTPLALGGIALEKILGVRVNAPWTPGAASHPGGQRSDA